MSRVSLFWSAAAAVLIVSGCGGGEDRWKSKRPATVPAQGLVTYNSAPLAGAVVVIQPGTPDGMGASALTDQEGKFELKTFPPDSGAVPGSYTVMVVKMEDSDGRSAPGEDAKGRAIMQKSLIPPKYGNPAQSGLKVEIPQAGTSTIQFDLKG